MTLATLNDPGFAGGAFAGIDVIDFESADMVLTVAAELGVPVALMVPHKAFPLLDLGRFIGRLRDWADAAPTPVCVHLDHGETLDGVKQALDAGFNSVMFDGSALPFEQNVELTATVCELARPYAASVEAELGKVGGDEGTFEEESSISNIYTDAGEAARFVRDTGVDALAISFGTSHGLYAGAPVLDFGIVRSIRQETSAKLVMHGASGLADHEYGTAVAAGISKINLFTEISVAGSNAAIAAAQGREGKIHYFEMMLAGKQALAARTAHYLGLIKTANGGSNG